MDGEEHEQYKRILNLGLKSSFKQLVSREQWVLGILLVGYWSNENRVWENMDWIIFHFDCKHLHQRVLPAIHQFCETER